MYNKKTLRTPFPSFASGGKCQIKKQTISAVMGMAFSLLLCLPTVHACEFLIGDWQSNKEMSYMYSEINGASDSQLSFIDQAFGHLRITFTNDKGIVHEVQPVELVIGDTTSEFSVDYSESPVLYDVCKANFTSYKFMNERGSYEVRSQVMLGKNTFVVSFEGNHISEYFTRM